MSSELLESNEGLTRAKVLKRAGIVAAAAWSVPFFSSTADAAVTPSKGNLAACAGTDNYGFPTPFCNFQQCGQGKNGTICVCYTGAKGAGKISGCCVCAGNEFCSQSPPCNTNADCPRGWKCTINNCGQTCVPPCGAGISQLRGSGNTTAG